MNHVHPPPAITWHLLASIGFVVLAFVIALTDCKPSAPSPPAEPPITYVDAADAAELADAGPDPDQCARACSSWARAGCIEATPNCLRICEKEILPNGFYDPRMIACVIDADGGKPAIQKCMNAQGLLYGLCP